jgi:hypothetical protein
MKKAFSGKNKIFTTHVEQGMRKLRLIRKSCYGISIFHLKSHYSHTAQKFKICKLCQYIKATCHSSVILKYNTVKKENLHYALRWVAETFG